MDEPAPSNGALPRRSAIRFLAASGLVGAVWGTGLSALNANRPASVTVAGENDWQLTLAESARSRAAILMGAPDRELADTLARMMGSFRQRIDLVIGRADALAAFPNGYRGRWNVQRTIVLGGAGAGSSAGATSTITSPTRITLGSQLSILLSPVIQDTSTDTGEADDTPVRWIASAGAYGGVIRIGAQLEDIVALNAGPTAMTIAPGGDLRVLWAFDPTSGIAVNNNHVPEDVIRADDSDPSSTHWLVSIFPEDFSRLTFLERGVGLPTWARRVRFLESQ